MNRISFLEAHAKYSYNPDTGKLWSKKRNKEVTKNGMVSGKQLRPYQIAYLLMVGYAVCLILQGEFASQHRTPQKEDE